MACAGTKNVKYTVIMTNFFVTLPICYEEPYH